MLVLPKCLQVNHLCSLLSYLHQYHRRLHRIDHLIDQQICHHILLQVNLPKVPRNSLHDNHRVDPAQLHPRSPPDIQLSSPAVNLDLGLLCDLQSSLFNSQHQFHQDNHHISQEVTLPCSLVEPLPVVPLDNLHANL